MADPRDRAPEIPDLDLPPPKSGGARPNVSSPPAAARPALRPVAGASTPPKIVEGSLDDLGFGMEIERGNVSAPPQSGPQSRRPGHGHGDVAIRIADDGDDFDMEIERGGALVSTPPAMSGRPPVSASGSPMASPSGRPALSSSGRPSGSGLEVAYARSDLARRGDEEEEPSAKDKAIAWAIVLGGALGALGGLVKLAHRSGGHSVTGLLPHAFDATSVPQSGGVAVVSFILAVALGYIGVKANPRSHAMIVSAAMLLIGALAMVTVTLVATEEHPTPADGALLIPYVMPLALALLGAGIAGRGVPLSYRGGAKHAAAAVCALLGGALLFAAIELSPLARLL